MKRNYDTAEVQAAREQYVPVFEYIKQNGGRTVQGYSRLRHCSAWVGTQMYGDKLYRVLKSYSTIVALYDVQTNTIVEYGHFSSTTYHHIAKFSSDMYLEYQVRSNIPAYHVNRINLEMCDWF